MLIYFPLKNYSVHTIHKADHNAPFLLVMPANPALFLISILSRVTQAFLNIDFLASHADSPGCDKHPHLDPKCTVTKEALGSGNSGNINKFISKMACFVSLLLTST